MAIELNRRVKEPARTGPWAWRELLPRCMCDLDDLRVRAATVSPEGINLTRFFRWLDAETMASVEADVPVLSAAAIDRLRAAAPTGSKALAKYRRFLYELNVDHERAHAGDVVLADLECAFERAVTPAEAGEVAALQNVDSWRSRVAA